MIMNNEKKQLSRSTRRIKRSITMDDNMKSLLNKLEAERKKKNKNFDKNKELEIE